MANPYEPGSIQAPDQFESFGERWLRGFGNGMKACVIFVGVLWALVTCGVVVTSFYGASAADTFSDIVDRIAEPLAAFFFGSICVSFIIIPIVGIVVGTGTAVIGSSKPKKQTNTGSQTY